MSLKRRLKSFISFIVMCFFMQTSFAMKTDVHIGVLSIWGEKVTRKMWQPTMDYLNSSIPTHQFVLKPFKLDQVIRAVKEEQIDFVITNPGNYVFLEANFGASRLATLKSKNQNKITNQFSAIIFTRHDRDDIQSLDDLRNKSFMGVKKKAFGGFQMAWLELKKNDIDPFKDFSSLQFSGLPQDKIVHAVLNGEVDAGTVRTTTLERMEAEGLIELKNFKILNQKISSNFPFIHSTRLYPEWPIAKLKDTSAKLAKQVSIALLELPEKSNAAVKANSAGWNVALDYFPVRNLYKELNLPPYQTVLPGFFERYWGQTLLFLMLFIQPLILYIRKLRIDRETDQEKLAQSEREWSNALDFLDEPMYMVDLNDRIIRANKAFYKKINSTPERAIGRVVTDFTHPEGEEIPCKVCQARKDLNNTVITLEEDDPVNKAGIPLEISVKVIRNNQDKAIGIIQRMRDLTASRNAQKALRRSESLFKELLAATPYPLLVSNMDGVITLANTQFEDEFGYNKNEIIGQKIEVLIPEQQRSKHIVKRTKYYFHPENREMGSNLSLKGLHKDGHTFPINISLKPFVIDNEMLIISTIHNITSRLEEEKELKRLASFPELNPNPILEFNKDGTVTYSNSATLEWFPDITQKGINHEMFSELEKEYPALEESHELLRNIIIGDSTYEQKITYDPKTKLFRTYIWDITNLKNLTQKMSYQASHDSLTNLYNRREFERCLGQAIDETQHKGVSHSICYMDLDQFKAVNDSCGHTAGDELLKQISTTISSILRDTDIFARLGGDEFGLLLAGCPIDKAKMLAEEIRKSVENFRFHWDEKIFKVGISIGIVVIDNTSGSIKEIQSAADTACYIAKEQGRNRVHIYKADDSAIAKHTNETNWLNRINLALDNDMFVLFFQKIASVKNAEHEHYEVLIRMFDNDGKTIPPNSFIPAAERFNVMSSVDSWVIKNTLLIMQKTECININFSINLSGQSLSDADFMHACINLITSSSVNTERLCFEITETAMIENLTNAIQSVSTLRDLGCKVALDDFGSGLSSFAYLKNLPVDYLKIDGSLIKDMETDKVNVTMVKSIIHIGRSMGLETIAEYVENQAIVDILQELNIDYVQGYGVAKPVPFKDLITVESNLPEATLSAE